MSIISQLLLHRQCPATLHLLLFLNVRERERERGRVRESRDLNVFIGAKVTAFEEK